VLPATAKIGGAGSGRPSKYLISLEPREFVDLASLKSGVEMLRRRKGLSKKQRFAIDEVLKHLASSGDTEEL
jgi:hypothetical protein